MKGFERIRERVVVMEMGANRARHDDREPKSGGEHGFRNKQTNGTYGLGDNDEVQKPARVAGLQEELSHVRVVGNFPDFSTDK